MSSKILVIYSSKNVRGMKDATGAFIPEALAFALQHGVPAEDMLGVDCVGQSAARRRIAVIDFLRSKSPYVEMVAMFCHGWPTGIQFGFNRQNVGDLVGELRMVGVKNLKLVLYACSAASNVSTRKTRVPKKIGPGTDRGFADMMRDQMLSAGFRGGWIDAHKTAGHTTMNPYVVRFYTTLPEDGDCDVQGGMWLVSPKSALWKKWRILLSQAGKDVWRFEFPFRTEQEIYRGLAA